MCGVMPHFIWQLTCKRFLLFHWREFFEVQRKIFPKPENNGNRRANFRNLILESFFRGFVWKVVFVRTGSLRAGELISLCVCSCLSEKTAKSDTDFCRLILKSLSCVETKPKKLSGCSSSAVASLCIHNTTLLLPTTMTVSVHCAMFAEQLPKQSISGSSQTPSRIEGGYSLKEVLTLVTTSGNLHYPWWLTLLFAASGRKPSFMALKSGDF